MSPRQHPTAAFSCAVAAAALAVIAISGNARAESPLANTASFAGAGSPDGSRIERPARGQLSSAGHEWLEQQSEALPRSDTTRAQTRSDFIGARDAVRWSNGEGGTAVMGGPPQRQTATYPTQPGR
jgi:hypothetical protein